MTNNYKHNASFRDPDAFVFSDGVSYFRQLNQSYAKDYDQLMQKGGLYEELIKNGLILPHEEVTDVTSPSVENQYKILSYPTLPFVSYPYEWCFGQYKEAAKTTLRIQVIALKHGMTLKDASAYNMQWHQGKMKLIDTTSLEIYEEGQPWIAYNQFCKHFLAPLSLMHYTDQRLNNLLKHYIDGFPLDLAVDLLPFKARLSLGNIMHLYLHAKSIKRHETTSDQVVKKVKTQQFSKTSIIALCDSLNSRINKLKVKNTETEWEDYYNNTNYTNSSDEHKIQLVTEFAEKTQCDSLWDLGGNTGKFTRLGDNASRFLLSADIDPLAVEQNYQQCKKEKNTHLLPLVIDLTNPSSGMGWAHNERDSFADRAPKGNTVMALALIHHIALSNNVPLEHVATYFSSLGEHLIIEFIPKTDSQVKILLTTREDIFVDYTEEGFETAFAGHYDIVAKESIKDSERTLYLMKRK